MNGRNRLLTGVLLVLGGILIGGILVLWQRAGNRDLNSTVHFTKIKSSETQYISDSSLAKINPKFLFKQVAARVKPSIVYITAIVSINQSIPHPKENQKQHQWWYRFRAPKAQTVGSGVIISPDGYIVTNAHVVRGSLKGEIKILLNNKREFKGHIVGEDFLTDLAVLKIDAKGLSAITFGNSNTLDVGEWVLAFGNPFELRQTVTAGIVSALNRDIHISGEVRSNYHIKDYIQTDAAINKGNSGGALVNTSGQLIGINTAIASKTGEYQGYGFAIPSNLVEKVAHDIIQFGEVHRALLGVQIGNITYSRAKDLGLKSIRGVEVIKLVDGGAAQKSDIEPGDVILALDGKPVNKANKLQEMIALHYPGDLVKFKIWRDGKTINRQIRLQGLSQDEMPGNEDS